MIKFVKEAYPIAEAGKIQFREIAQNKGEFPIKKKWINVFFYFLFKTIFPVSVHQHFPFNIGILKCKHLITNFKDEIK